MKSVALHNLGCKVNAYELEVIGQKLQESGYMIVPFDDKADIYIVNTCTVTNIADRKSRQMLHRAKKRNPDAVVVAVGCYVQTGKEEALLDGSIDLAVGNNRKKDLLPILEAVVEERERNRAEAGRDAAADVKTLHHTSVVDISREEAYEEMSLSGWNKEDGGASQRTRAYIKIQDGCNQFCSYCIIPYARGRVRSRKQEDILKEVRGLAREGYKEIVFTGIHISSYGMDFIDKSDGDYLENGKDLRGTAMERAYLLNLVREIAEVDGIERIRLGSLEPRIITEKFVNGLAAVPKVCPHFHLSLQSGCDETLKRMNRHYTTEEYYDKVKLLRQVFGNPAITTDVITGFPGETEEEFAVTRRFLEKVDFFEMHVFKYSRRQGTVAASMENQVPETVKAVRSGELLELEKRQSAAYRKGYIGKEITILTEEAREINGERYRIGHTDTYVKAAVPDEKAEGNMLVAGKAVKLLTEEILLLES